MGQDSAHASEILKTAGLVGKPTSAFNDTAPIDHVVSTDPGEASRIRKGGTVTFVVSKGPDLVTFPAGVVGALQAPAEAALASADLTPTYGDPVYDDVAGLGVVMSAKLPDGTDAVAGAQVNRKAVVTLVLSNGPAPVKITSIVNLSVEDATKAVAADNLKIAPTEVFNDTVAAGLIIDQTPAPDTDGHRGDTITVNVSKGPDLVPLEDTYGQNVKKAKATLEAAGFVVVVQQPQGISPLNLVYSQSPGGGDGKSAPRGATITLSVF